MRYIMINYNQLLEKKNIQCHYMDTDSFVLGMNTISINKNSENPNDIIFDFSNLDENHDLFSNKNKKIISKFKIETLKKTIHEIIAFRSKVYSFKCKSDECKGNTKGISKSQSKHIKFEEYKNVYMVKTKKKNVIIIF